MENPAQFWVEINIIVLDRLAHLLLTGFAPRESDIGCGEPSTNVILRRLVIADRVMLRGLEHPAPVLGHRARQDHGMNMIGLFVTICPSVDAIVPEGFSNHSTPSLSKAASRVS